MEIKTTACSGDGDILVKSDVVGYGSSKDAARANLMDKIGKLGDETDPLKCGSRTCSEGAGCAGVVKDDDLEKNGKVTYARGAGQWLAWFDLADGVGQNVKVHCKCVPTV